LHNNHLFMAKARTQSFMLNRRVQTPRARLANDAVLLVHLFARDGIITYGTDMQPYRKIEV
jgi:hypothetical protein